MFFEIANAANSTANWVFTTRMEIWDFILLAISVVVLFAWVFSISYILWWGILLILSGWKDDKIKPAINSIRYAVIWLIVIVISIFIFPKITSLLWLDVDKYSSPDKIFIEIQRLWNKVFNWEKSTNQDLIDTNNLDNLPIDFTEL